MKKQVVSQPSFEENLSLLDENPTIHWIIQHRLHILLTLLGVVLAIILLFRVVTGEESQSESHYLNADKEFRLFMRPGISQEASAESLTKLKVILKQHPELHAKYDGLIAQTLINQGNIQEASEFAGLAIARTATENNPYYSEYAKTTLLIGQKNYKEALQQAEQLQQALLKAEVVPGETLIAFNLLRVGMLQQQLGDKEAEANTWKQWHELSQNIKQAVDHLQIGTITLLDYIQEREAILNAD